MPYDLRMSHRARPLLKIAVAAVVLASGIVVVAGVAAAEPGFSALQAMPAIPGSSTPPDAPYGAVSCPTITSCTAAGPFGHISLEGRPTVVTETAGAWGAPTAIALPSGGISGTSDPAQFNAISCGSVGNCLAVGDYPTANGLLPMLAEESAGAWGAASSPALPSGGNSISKAALTGAWCASAGNCVVVGFYVNTSQGEQGFSATESSGTWGAAAVLPLGAGAPFILAPMALSCTDVMDCTTVAVGLGATALTGYAWTETAGTWAAATKVGVGDWFYGVACPSATTCLAVGFAARTSLPIVVQETSGTWGATKVLAGPRLAPTLGGGGLTGISCNSGVCVAVGQLLASGTRFNGGGAAIAATWAGGTWSSVGVAHGFRAKGKAATDTAFTAVSCSSATQCLGVGYAGFYPYKSANEPLYPVSLQLTPARRVVAPGPPTQVAATPRLHGVIATWLPPTDDGGAPVTTFTATARPGGRTCTSSRDRCQIAGLADGHRYRVFVTDQTSFGPSAAAASAPFVAGTAPSVPRDVRVTQSNGVAVVSWHASVSPPGEPVTGYDVNGEVRGSEFNACQSYAGACTIVRLDKGQVYTIWVDATDATGTSVSGRVRFVAK